MTEAWTRSFAWTDRIVAGAGWMLLVSWIAAALLGVLTTATPASAQLRSSPAPLHLVMPFENTTGEPRAYWLSEASAILLTDNLIAHGTPAIRRDDRLRAFDPLRVPPVTTLSHATVIRVAQIVGAEHVVIGGIEIEGDDLVVNVRTIRLDTGRISPEIVEQGALADLLGIYRRVAARLIGAPSDGQPESVYVSLPAFEQYVKGLLAEAAETKIAFLTQALRIEAEFQRPRVALWDVYSQQGRHQEALAAVREVPSNHRLARVALFLGTVSMLHLGRVGEAFDELVLLRDSAPDPAVLNNMGVAQLRRGGAGGGRAVSYFGEAVSLDGSDPDLFFNLGYAYWLDRDMQGAIYWLREAVRRNPADDAAHYVLGAALQASGNAAEAARERELARRLSSAYAEWEAMQPTGSSVPGGLERLKLEIDVPASLRIDAAVVAAEQRDQRAIAEFHLERGRRFFDEERDAEAIAELRRTVFLAPYESEAHLLLGRIFLRTGRQQDAIDALTIAVWSNPDDAGARALLESIQ